MLHRLFILLIFIIILPTIIFSQQVILLKIDGAINPASAAFIERGIESATEKNAECLIIQLNTPGGLLAIYSNYRKCNTRIQNSNRCLCCSGRCTCRFSRRLHYNGSTHCSNGTWNKYRSCSSCRFAGQNGFGDG